MNEQLTQAVSFVKQNWPWFAAGGYLAANALLLAFFHGAYAQDRRDEELSDRQHKLRREHPEVVILTDARKKRTGE